MLDVKEAILGTFYKVTGRKVSACNSNLFSAPNYFTPRDLAYVFLTLKSILDIDLDYIYQNLKEISIDELVTLIDNRT